MESSYTFKFKNITYKLTDKWEETCLNDSKQFQLEQFEHLIKTHDYVTVQNRINNQLKFGYLQKI
jgi:hypothetical protein